MCKVIESLDNLEKEIENLRESRNLLCEENRKLKCVLKKQLTNSKTSMCSSSHRRRRSRKSKDSCCSQRIQRKVKNFRKCYCSKERKRCKCVCFAPYRKPSCSPRPCVRRFPRPCLKDTRAVPLDLVLKDTRAVPLDLVLEDVRLPKNINY
ncbi:hypothetical protein WDU94_014516 [Cyamophila willieti]